MRDCRRAEAVIRVRVLKMKMNCSATCTGRNECKRVEAGARMKDTPVHCVRMNINE